MARSEGAFNRDLSYNIFHRDKGSIDRYIGQDQAGYLWMCDIDSVDYDRKGPFLIIDTIIDVGQSHIVKLPPTPYLTIAESLSYMYNNKYGIDYKVPVLVVCYKQSAVLNPLSQRHIKKRPFDNKVLDIESFRVKCVWPEESGEKFYTAKEWAFELLKYKNKWRLAWNK